MAETTEPVEEIAEAPAILEPRNLFMWVAARWCGAPLPSDFDAPSPTRDPALLPRERQP